MIDIGEPVRKRDFMNVYHRHSTRTTTSRSSFANNVGPYTRGAGCVLEQFHGEVLNKKNKTTYHWEATEATNGIGALVGTKVKRTVDMLRWVGPSIDEWLATMIERDLDKAFGMLESRLLNVDERDDNEEERSLTVRWLDRVRGEIARRAQ
jgi:hypothetical protein